MQGLGVQANLVSEIVKVAPKTLTQGQQILIKGLSGAIGAGVSALILFPMENLKTRIMLENNDTDDKKGLLETIRKIIKEEGMQGFFLGLKPYFIYSVASYWVFFIAYESFKTFFDSKSSSEIWVAGFNAGITATLLTSPLSMVSNYIISIGKKQKRILGYKQAILEIYEKYGFRGFYIGLMFSLLLVINPTINMTFFERLKVILPKMMNKDFALFLSGAISKLLATVSTYPLTTVRTNMQSGSGMTSLESILYILENFGPFGFYKGLSAKILQSVLNSAMMLFLYERINEFVVKAVTGA